MKKKRLLTIVCSAVLIASIAIGGTLAYFFDKEEVKNEFTTAGGDNPEAGVDIEIEEPGFIPEEAEDIISGDIVIKDPKVICVRGEVYARMIITLQNKDGSQITDATRANKILSMIYYSTTPITPRTEAQLATLPRVNSAFTLDAARGGVGKYYYNYTGTLQHGQEATLFSGVCFPTDWNQDDAAEMGNFDIVVGAQAIQRENIATATEAFNALDAEI